MSPLACLIPIVALSLCACDNRHEKADSPSQPEPSTEEQAATLETIGELEREIESSKQIIDDLGAAVVMERAKLEDDPNYDQSFLEEILSDQDRERQDIEKAQKDLDALTHP